MDGGRKWQEIWQHLGTFHDAVVCPKVDLRAGDLQDDVGFMGRKPECNAFDGGECGFEGPGGILICTRLERSLEEVRWKVSEDVITKPASTDGKAKAKDLHNQTNPNSASSATSGPRSRRTASGTRLTIRLQSTEDTATEVVWRRLKMSALSSKRTSPRSTPTNLHEHDDARLPANDIHDSNSALEPTDALGGQQDARHGDVDLRVWGHDEHDWDFHPRGLARIADCTCGDGSEATAATRNDGRTPRMGPHFHGWVRRAVQGNAKKNAYWRTALGRSASSSTTISWLHLTSRIATMESAARPRTS